MQEGAQDMAHQASQQFHDMTADAHNHLVDDERAARLHGPFEIAPLLPQGRPPGRVEAEFDGQRQVLQ